MILCELKEYDKSVQCYDEALILEPKNATVLYHKARVTVLKNKIDEGVELLEKICMLDPSKKEIIRMDGVFSDLYTMERFRIVVN